MSTHAWIHWQTKRGASMGKRVSLAYLESELAHFARRKVEAVAEVDGEEVGAVKFTDAGADGVLWYVYLAEHAPV